VQPGGVSSLIFLVVIGVWAAYFIQYWVRRRDHLATARSVDQFSESMRVLERRHPLSTADLSTQAPRSYAVGPARSPRAQILVKRAAPSPEAQPVDHETAWGDDRDARRTHAAARATARRNRALVMLGALSTVVVAVPLVALGLLSAAWLLVPVLSVGAAVAWSRWSARASGSASTGRDLPVRSDDRARVVRPRVQQRPADLAAAGAPASDDRPAGAGPTERVEDVAAPAAMTTPRPRRELYDIEAADTTRVQAPAAAQAAPMPKAPAATARPLVDEDDIPLTWDPVPVPRPTYTLKSRATRPAPTAADLVGDADTEYAAYDDAEPVRRVAGA